MANPKSLKERLELAISNPNEFNRQIVAAIMEIAAALDADSGVERENLQATLNGELEE